MAPKKAKVAVTPEVPLIALIDANVFFGPRLRDIFMHLHEHELINIHWTSEIEREWTRNVVAKQGANPRDIEDCQHGMRKAVPGWQVQGYEKYTAQFDAVQAKDRHVAAAAYKLTEADWPGQDVVLVTNNLTDFPVEAFAGTRVRVMPPGAYVDSLYALAPERVVAVVEGCRKKLRNPPIERGTYVGVLMKQRCSNLAKHLASKWNVECPEIRSDGTLFFPSEQKAQSKPKTVPKTKKK